MDYYDILGVEKNADEEAIKSAYRKKAMELHPDRNPGDKEAERLFKEVQTAYDTLSDPIQKSKYDGRRTTSAGPNPFSGSHPFSGIWDSVFTKNTTQQPVDRGRNIQVNVEVELKDVLSGITKNIAIPKRKRCDKCTGNGYTEHKACKSCHGSGKTAIKQSPFNIWLSCSDCQGTGRSGTINCADCKGQGFLTTGNIEISVTIPPGVDTGYQLRLADYGEPSKKLEGKNGDLHIIIIVKEHKLFKRHGVNLTYEFPVGYAELCLGGSVEVPTLNGLAAITIPPNTLDYTQFRLKGMGLPYFHGGKGDLIIVAKLVMPAYNMINSNKELFQNISQFEKDFLIKERDKFK